MGEKTPSVADILKNAMKKHDLRVGPLTHVADKVEALTTGNLGIDHIIGVGGLPIGRSVELFGPPGCGKSLDCKETVLTPTGPVEIGSLLVGDLIVSPDEVSTVLGVYPQGKLKIYSVVLSDGRTVRASGDHLWQVDLYDRGNWHSKVLTTDSIASRCEWSRPRIRVPYVTAVDYGLTPSIDPYLAGLLLGDGSTVRGVRFYSGDEELFSAVKERVPHDVEIVPVLQPDRCAAVTLKGMWRYLRPLGMMKKRAWEKSVPREFLYSSVANRLAVLQGLMDTDGGVSEGRGEFCSSSEQLSKDVAWLVRSLGGQARESSSVSASGRRRYRVWARMPVGVSEFALARKKTLLRHAETSAFIVRVEEAGDSDCVCIEVSSQTHLFLTGDCVPTHNTTTALQAIAEEQQRIIASGEEFYILYSDYEHALDKRYASSLGIDVDHPSFLFTQPDNFEQGANVARDLIGTGRVRIAIWDSVAGMNPADMSAADVGKSLPALQARLMSDFLRKLNPEIHTNKTCAVFLNHEQEVMNMGRPGPPSTTTPGGKALKYYASLRIQYRPMQRHKIDVLDKLTGAKIQRADGATVRVIVVKNKVAPPFMETIVRVRYGKGFDNFWTAMSVLVGHGKVKNSAGYYYFNDVPELVIDDMSRTTSERPFVRGEEALLKFADKRMEWRRSVIDYAQHLIDTMGTDVFVAQEEIDEDDDKELPSLTGGLDLEDV